MLYLVINVQMLLNSLSGDLNARLPESCGQSSVTIQDWACPHLCLIIFVKFYLLRKEKKHWWFWKIFSFCSMHAIAIFLLHFFKGIKHGQIWVAIMEAQVHAWRQEWSFASLVHFGACHIGVKCSLFGSVKFEALPRVIIYQSLIIQLNLKLIAAY